MSEFSRLAYSRLLVEEPVNLRELAAKMNVSIAHLARLLEEDIPFEFEQALDLVRCADDIMLLKWVMERLGARRYQTEDEDEGPFEVKYKVH